MIRPKVLKTFSFRLALWYVALFAVSATVVFGFIWWAAVTFMLGQTDDIIESEVWSLVEQYDERGLAALSMQISSRQRNEASRSNIYLLVDREMHYLAGNMRQWPPGIEPKGYPEWHTIPVTAADDPKPLQARVRVVTLMGKIHMLVGRELSDVMRARAIMAIAMATGICITVVMGLIWGNVMSVKLLRRLDEINDASREIMGGAMGKRIPLSGSGDEFDRLAANLNDMLDRIVELLATVRQVSDNIAHDLRSPLTRLRSRLELALLEPQDTVSQRQAMEEAIDQAESIIATFNALLTIARAESAAARDNFEELDLSVLVRDAVELYEPLAEDKNIALAVSALDGLMVWGNRHLLSQAVVNLLDNAVKYTPEAGAIRVGVCLEENGCASRKPAQPGALPGRGQEAATDKGAGGETANLAGNGAQGGNGGCIVLSVADTGPGIPEAERANVLKRFYRLDESRGTPGSGLGLSLVAAVARLHGAKLEFREQSPGLEILVAFPPASRVRSSETRPGDSVQ
ncbi:HAMP domain-containing sensor histidine kinase [Fundidesulfovibrio terrae]|uniref:HAMP domain-containing sensor histidine kinase n=1 Tax=Fundidesulfovibrio terrae TaxID=2922866 RepID=UPI00311AB606